MPKVSAASESVQAEVETVRAAVGDFHLLEDVLRWQAPGYLVFDTT